MRSGFCSAGALAAIAFLAGCGQTIGPKSPGNVTSALGPTITSCGIPLCATGPPVSSATADTTASGVSRWVVATANLAGLPSECGNVTFMSARPDRDMLIAGVARQGLWVSDNGSNTWTRLGQGSGSDVITNRLSSITYDPNDPNRFWESGIYNGGGSYQTLDDGVRFKRLGDLIHSDFVSVDLSDPARRTMLSGRHEASKLFRSGDGGATWVDLSSTLPASIGITTSPLVVNARLHLLGTAAGHASGVFRTTDGGATWSRVYQGGVSGPALVTRSGGAIYWLLEMGNGLIRSSDQGLTWKTVVGPGQISTNSSSLIELPDGRLVTLGANVIVSADQGVTWQSIGPALPYPPTGIVYAASRKAFYAWRSDCNVAGDTSVKADAIVRLDYDYRVAAP